MVASRHGSASDGTSTQIGPQYFCGGTVGPFATAYWNTILYIESYVKSAELISVRRCLMRLLAFPKQFSPGLRTKFLLSLVLTTVGLSFATLLSVRHATRNHAQQEIVADTNSSLMTFQVLLHQNEVTLRRKADLLATLAAVTNDDDPTLQESSDNALETDGSDLVVLADRTNKITALHVTSANLTSGIARELLVKSLARRNTSDWWDVNGALYQVVLQPIDRHPHPEYSQLGTVVVGRVIDYAMVHDLGRISASQVVFSYGTDVVVGTLNTFAKYDLAACLESLSVPREIQIGNERFFARSLQLSNGSGPNVRLTVLKSYNETTAFLSALNRMHIGLGLVALVGGTLAAIFLSGRFTRPLATLDEGVRALEHGDFNFPLETHGCDEVAHLARAFDQMRNTLQRNETQKQQLEDQLRQSQKMEALGRLAGGVAHDFNNLLTIIKGHSDLMLEHLNPADPLSGSGEQIRKAADRAASLTRQMLAFSRRQALELKVVDLNALVAEMSKLLKRLIREDIEFVFGPGKSLGRVKADTGQIEQVILNLVVNACDAMPQGGKLIIETQNVIAELDHKQIRPALEPGQYVMLTVTDTGHGMNEETRARIFEPFFTTKEKGKGTGLGLATVYGVVRQSGGFIWVDTAPGRGAKFSIYLPRVEQNVEPLQTESLAPTHAAAAETILLVEDEEALRSLAHRFLTSAGYRVLAATDGEKALAIATKFDGPIHLLVTDVVMPRMRGTELAKRLRSFYPDLKVVYMSGYLEENQRSADFLEDAVFLQKPFSRHTLVDHVRSALSGKSSTVVEISVPFCFGASVGNATLR